MISNRGSYSRKYSILPRLLYYKVSSYVRTKMHSCSKTVVTKVVGAPSFVVNVNGGKKERKKERKKEKR